MSRARSAAWLVATVILAGVGGYLVVGDERAWRRMAYCAWEHQSVKKQLEDLKVQLLDFRKTHGRLPTNDEGLAALDNFDARFVVPYATAYRNGGHEYWLGLWQEDNRKALANYRTASARAPQSYEEFVKAHCLPPPPNDLIREDFDLVISRSGGVFAVTDAGILSPWGLPYLYENRLGKEAAFADSPPSLDKRGRYSLRVDDGIYLCSVGAEKDSMEYDRAWWEYNTPRFIGAGLLLLGVVLAIARIVTRGVKAVGMVVAWFLAGILGAAVSPVVTTTCYVPAHLYFRKDAAMIARQRHLLETYHARGVISDATYQKALSALATETPTDKPRSQSAP